MKKNFMRCPKSLKSGDSVALVAPCSPVSENSVIAAADIISSMGYQPIIYPSCCARCENTAINYLSGNDEVRAEDINSAFADKKIKAIIAMRGGYGGARLAKYLNYGIIRENPKIFCGFSDVTLLHAILNQRCGLVTFHTPMPASEAFRSDRLSMDGLRNILSGEWDMKYSGGLKCVSEGSAKGILTGGNLTVIASTVGTPYQLDTEGKILFLEDVGEEAYRIDRYLVQMRDGGSFDKCSGIILGTWKDCLPDDLVADILMDVLFEKNIPIISGLPCGHSVPSISLPLGLTAEIHSFSDKCRITVSRGEP